MASFKNNSNNSNISTMHHGGEAATGGASTAATATASSVDPSQLSFRDMAVDASGAVMSRDQKYQLRVKHGYCTTCPDIPVKLFDMKRSRLNPLWSTKTPRNNAAEHSVNGICLRCTPTAKTTRAATATSTASTANNAAPSNSMARTNSNNSHNMSVATTTTTTATMTGSSPSLSQRSMRSTNSSSHHGINHNLMDPSLQHGRSGMLVPAAVGGSVGGHPYHPHTHRSMPHVIPPDHHPHRSSSPRRVALNLSNRSNSHSSNANNSSNNNNSPHHHHHHTARPGNHNRTPSFRRQSIHLATPDVVVGTAAREDSDTNNVSGNNNSTSHSSTVSMLWPAVSPHVIPSNSSSPGTNSMDSSQRRGSFQSVQRVPSFRNNNNRSNNNINNMVRQASTRSTISTLSDCPTSSSTHNGHQQLDRQVSMDINMMEREASTRSFDIGVEDSFSNFHVSVHSHQQHHNNNGGLTATSEEQRQPTKDSRGGWTSAASSYLYNSSNNASAASGLSDTTDEGDALSLQGEGGGIAGIAKNKTVQNLQALVNDLVSASSFDVLADVLTNAMKAAATDYDKTTTTADNNTNDVPAFCLQAFATYFEDQPPHVLVHAGVHKILVHTLKRYEHSPAIQKQACVVVCLLAQHDTSRSLLVQAGLPFPLQKLLTRRTMESASLMTVSLAAIRSLSVDAEARSVFKNSQSLSHSVVQVMQYHATIREIQRDGCAILSNLAVDLERKLVSTVDQETLECILAALDTHAQDASVVSSAMFALKNFTYDETNLCTLSRIPQVNQVLEQTEESQQQPAPCEDALIVMERVQIKQIEDLSMEEQALESLAAHVQFKAENQDPMLVCDILDAMDMYRWSSKIVLECLQRLAKLVDLSSGHYSSVVHKLVLENDETALPRIKMYQAIFGSHPDIGQAADSILTIYGKQGGSCAEQQHQQNNGQKLSPPHVIEAGPSHSSQEDCDDDDDEWEE